MRFKWSFGALCVLFMAGGAYWLWRSGYGNLLAYGMILLCPLMHLFMHRSLGNGHGAGHDHGDGVSLDKTDKKPACH